MWAVVEAGEQQGGVGPMETWEGGGPANGAAANSFRQCPPPPKLQSQCKQNFPFEREALRLNCTFNLFLLPVTI